MFKKLVFKIIFIFFSFVFLNSLIPYLLNSSFVYAFQETTYYIHQDNIGSIVSVTNDATTSGKIDYSSYGSENKRTLEQENSREATERTYTGQIQDTSTSLSYYNSRYYDPNLSRFISADSVSGGNRYAYVSNNPISASDPSGNVITMGDGGGGSSNGGVCGRICQLNRMSQADGMNPNYAQDVLSAGEQQMASGVPQKVSALISTINSTRDPAALVVSVLEMVTLGGFSSLTNTAQKYAEDNMALNAKYPSSDFFGDINAMPERLSASVAPGITGVMFAMGPAKLIQNKLGWIKNSLSVDIPIEQYAASEYVTVYKGLSAKALGQDIIPRVEMDFDMGAGITRTGIPSTDQIAKMRGWGMSDVDIAIKHVNVSDQWTPALSWTTDPDIALSYAQGYANSGGGAVIKAQIPRSAGVYIPDVSMSKLKALEEYVLNGVQHQQEFVTFGRFPASKYNVLQIIGQ